MDARPNDLQAAPFFAEIAKGPEGAQAHWVKTNDGLRIRVGHWQSEATTKGTVLLFPGRTEYIEKYGPAAGELANRGYATVTIDWRGQGLADRMLADRRLGHVVDFQDFQKDVAAALDLADRLALPKPYFLIGHSMGGAIGLRAAMEGLPVKACVFTGPMWDIHIAPMMRPFGKLMGKIGPVIGLGGKLVPTTDLQTYVLANPFEGNTLTNDRACYQFMRDQLTAHPDLALGGPTINWLGQGLKDCAVLAAMASPALPCITFLGKQEQIVDCPAIHDRMARWPGGELELLDDVQHEVMMEAPAVRTQVFDRMCSLFDQHR
ncbi:alpha/beta hydrolase [Parasedimentitalea marina]|uniref:Alpha/beta hydrolase n=1 Tax=Parasedimentitalea marina TaxID=2483033 RepID=A0A3T0N3K1_9RHOB|nr:alpha/beta hydrolase [Parasedimentitalea marina]AZV78606.1 alpha/beta hydrolase [Parasedimentitalea marina]